MPEPLSNIELSTEQISPQTSLTEGTKTSNPLENVEDLDYGSTLSPERIFVGGFIDEPSKFDIDLTLEDIGDLENQRGLIQPAAAKIAAGAGRLVTTTGTKLLEGFGYAATAPIGLAAGDITVMTDNAWSTAFSNLEEEVKTAMPVYKTNKYLQGNILNQMGTLEFWMDDVVDGLAFMTSAIIGSKGISSLGKAAGATGKLAKTASRLTKAAQTGKHSNIPRGLSATVQDTELLGMTLYNSMSEAGFEAKEVKDRTLAGLQKQIESGSITEEEANLRASKAARNTFLANVVALMPSNYIQNSLIFKSFRGGKGRINQLFENGQYTGSEIKDLTKREILGIFGRNAGKSVLSEGVWEENIQLAVSNYEEQLALTNDSNRARLLGYANEWVNNFSTDEGQKSIVLGAIIGLLPGGIGGVREAREERRALQQLRPLVDMSISASKEGLIQNFYKRKVEFDDKGQPYEINAVEVDENNNPVIDWRKVSDVFKKRNLRTNTDLAAMLEAVGTDKKVMFDWLQNMNMAEIIYPFLEEDGGIEHADNQLEVLARQEVEDLQRAGEVTEDAVAQEVQDKVSDYKQKLRQYKRVYDTIRDYQLPSFDYTRFDDHAAYAKQRLALDQYSEAINQQFWQDYRNELESEKTELNNFPVFRNEAARERLEELEEIGSLKQIYLDQVDNKIKQVDGVLEESYNRYRNLLDENKQVKRFREEAKLAEAGKAEIENKRNKVAEETERTPEEVTVDEVTDEEVDDVVDTTIAEEGETIQYYDENDNLVEGDVVSYNPESDEYVVSRNEEEHTVPRGRTRNLSDITPDQSVEPDDSPEPLSQDEVPEEEENATPKDSEIDTDADQVFTVNYSYFKDKSKRGSSPYSVNKSDLEFTNEEFHNYISDPKNDLKNATADFTIDFDSNDFVKNWWAKRQGLKNKIQSGRATKEDIANFISEISIKISFKDNNKTFTDRLYYPTAKGFRPAVNEQVKRRRAEILTQLINGNTYTITSFTKNAGRVLVGEGNKNIREVVKNVTSVGIARSNRRIFTGKKNLKDSGTPGNVFIQTPESSNGALINIKANIAKLSREHAMILFDAIRLAHTKGQGGFTAIMDHPQVKGDLTVGQVIQFLALFGERKTSLTYKNKKEGIDNTKNLPKYLLNKQFYVENGNILRYGEEGAFNLFEATEDQIEDYIEWATNNKNYAVSHTLSQFKGVTLEDKIGKDFSIGNITAKANQKYSDILIDNNILLTNAIRENNAITFAPKLYMHFNAGSVKITTPKKQQPKKQVSQTTKAITTELKEGENKVTSGKMLSGLPVGTTVYTKVEEYDDEGNVVSTDISVRFRIGAGGVVDLAGVRNKSSLKQFEGQPISTVGKKLFKSMTGVSLFAEVEDTPADAATKEQLPQKPKGSSNIDDLWDDYAPLMEANPTLYKSFPKIDIQKELEWFNDRFSNVPVEVINGLIESARLGKQAFGRYRKDMIELSNAAVEGALYHESFHRVSLAYLTDQQRQSIYDEARQRYGLKDVSDRQVEERLAEEFRLYVIKEGQQPIKEGFIKRLFKAIFSAIRAFFTGSNRLTPLDIDKLFLAIQNGKFKYSTVLKQNLPYQEDEYLMQVKGHNFQSIDNGKQLRTLVRGLTYVVVKDNNITDLESISNIDFTVIDNTLNEKIARLHNFITNNQDNTDSEVQSKVNNAIRLSGLYNEILDNPLVFRELIEDNLASLNVRRLRSPEDYNEEDNLVVDRGFEQFNKTSYEFSAKDNIRSRVKLMIGTLHKSKTRDPFTGMFEFVDFDEAWSMITRDLHDTETVEDMLRKIESKSDHFVYQQLYKRLTDGGIDLQTQFEVSTKLHRHRFINVLFERVEHEDGTISLQYKNRDADTQKMANIIRKEWSTNFTKSPVFKQVQGQPITINKPSAQNINKEFDRLRTKINKEFDRFTNLTDADSYLEELVSHLASVSIVVDTDTLRGITDSKYHNQDFDAGLVELVNNDLFYLFDMIGNLGKGQIPQKGDKNLPYNEILSNERVVSLLAESFADTHPEEKSDMVVGPQGNPYFVYSLNNIVTDTARWIRNNEHGYLDDLGRVVYNKNSRFINQLQDDNKRRQFYISTLSGLYEENAADTGRGYQEITDVEDYLLKVYLTSQSILPFPTLADKKTYFLYHGLDKIDFKYQTREGKLVLPDEVVDIFVNYAEDEYNRIQKVKAEVDAATIQNPDGTVTYNTNQLIENYHYQNFGGKLRIKYGGEYQGNGTKYQHFTRFNDRPPVTNGVFDREKATKDIRRSLTARIQEEVEYAGELGIIETSGQSKNIRVINNILLDTSLINNLSKEFNNEADAVANVIADFTLNTIMSTIETEKLLSGDPAYYKANKKTNTTEEDKIKRLSALTATGTSSREAVPDYSSELQSPFYTSATFNSVEVNSEELFNSLVEQQVPFYEDLLKDQYEDKDELTRKARELAKIKLGAYKEVDQTDAQVFISPEMYRSLSIRWGEWSDAKQKAYDLLQSNKEISVENEQELRNLVMQPLKPVYFGFEFNNDNAIPIYDKMSMATLFRRVVKGTQLEDVLDRMEGKGKYEGFDKVDQIKFHTATKVGNRGRVDANSDLTQLPTYPQQFRYLRQQLTTDPHDVSTTLLGTQFKKVGILNVDKAANYNVGGQEMTGDELLRTVSQSIVDLSDRGKERLFNKLGIEGDNYKYMDSSKLYQMLRDDAKLSNMPDALIDALVMDNGEPFVEIDALPDRKWMHGRMMSLVNKFNIDLKLPGNQFIQQTNFGLRSVEVDDSLQMWDDKDRVQARVSVGLFKNIIPDYYGKTFEQQRQWINDNKEVLEGIGFRIPTQGQNSTVPINFVEVLPEIAGDTIILPAEFTALTGSDFDIDKLFAVRFNYFVDKNDKAHKIKFLNVDTNTTEGLTELYNAKYGRIKSLFNRLDSYISDEYEQALESDLNGDQEVNRLLTAIIGEVPELFSDEEIDAILQEETQGVYTLEDYNSLEDRIANIPTLESYIEQNKGKSVYTLNSKSAVENQLLNAYFGVLTNNNHILFTKTPLDANKSALQKLATKARGKVPSFVPMLSTVSPKYQALVKKKYQGGKRGIGPYALNLVHHALGQQAGLTLNEYLGYGNVVDGVTDLSQTYGVDNIAISDWLSALVDAHVDIAKDPYIFDLNINDFTHSVASLLIRAGWGDTTFKLIAQPIIKELAVEWARTRGNLGATKGKFVQNVRNRWLNKANISPESIEPFEVTSQLDNDLQPKDTQEYAARQLSYLEEFEKLREISQDLFNLVLVNQVDTKKFGKNLVEVKGFINNMNQVYNSDRFSNVDKLMDYIPNEQSAGNKDQSTFLTGLLDNSVLLSYQLFRDKSVVASEGFLSEHEHIMELLNQKYASGEEGNRLINLISDELFAYLSSHFFRAEQGLDIKGGDFRQLFLGNNSIVNLIYEIKTGEKFKHLKDNALIKLMNVEFSDDIANKPSYITIPSTKPKEKWTKDDLIRSWEDMFNDDSKSVRSLARALWAYSFYTSGFKQNLYTYFNYIPPKITVDIENKNGELVSFNQFIKDTREVLNSNDNSEILSRAVPEIFENNWYNPTLVPVALDKDLSNRKNIKSKQRTYPILASASEFVGFDQSSKRISVGVNSEGIPMYRPYILLKRTDGTNYLMKYLGYSEDTASPIYYTVEKKGYREQGRPSIREYGESRSVFKDNRLPKTLSFDEAVQAASEKYPGFKPVTIEEMRVVYGKKLQTTQEATTTEELGVTRETTVEESPFISDQELLSQGLNVQLSTDMTEQELNELREKYKHC